uniref:Sodium/hydrogen exchanger n=1 Tax=Panagrolaimus superbus TaxID=310955 RepID=A0A914Z9U9_9BILA
MALNNVYVFHLNKKFGDAFPDSACLIVVGLLLGFALTEFNVNSSFFSFDSHIFFLYLLPPIIFDAGYFMPNRQLFENLDSVMVFAFVGTIYNTIAISCTLYICGLYGLFAIEFSLFEIMLFAALISAVDPVAVIAVFEEVHVNEFLFINVFGEALFNDGAAVVLYLMFKKFNDIGEENVIYIDYIAGGCSFFVIALGGVLIGIVFALIVSFITKYSDPVKILAPVFIVTIPYLAYLTAEMFHLSSILAIVSCGIVMKGYVKGNLSYEGNTSVKYFIKMLAQCSETVIFMFLGLSTVSSEHKWDTMFITITIASCLIFRTIGVIIECAILNRFRTKKFTAVDQFVLSYGGLRGAIAFGLAVSMPVSIVARPMFLTTTIAVIFFTVFVQGITIRPLLSWLKVERAEERDVSLVENVYNRYCDYTMAGIEDIIGMNGKHTLRDNYERFNSKVLKPILMKSYQKHYFDATQILRAYTKVIVQDAMKTAKSGAGGTPKTNQISPVAAEIQMQKLQDQIGHSNIADKFDAEMNPQQNHEQQNSEELYQMFSHLLDAKIEEIRKAVQDGSGLDTIMPKNDIEDDYMGIMQQQSLSNNNNNNNNIIDSNALRVNNNNNNNNSNNSSIYRRSMSNPNVSKNFP